MLDEEIIVSPLLELGVVLLIVLVADLGCGESVGVERGQDRGASGLRVEPRGQQALALAHLLVGVHAHPSPHRTPILTLP